MACVYYGLSLKIDGFGVNIYLTQFIFGAIEVPGKALIYFSVKKIGRRLSQAGSLVLTGLCVLCNIFIPRGKSVQVCVSLEVHRRTFLCGPSSTFWGSTGTFGLGLEVLNICDWSSKGSIY